MSGRVVSVLRDLAPEVEVYSIDESFLRVETVCHLYGGSVGMGQAIRSRLARWTGLPVCVGFAATKTLAKFANHLAKKNPQFAGVCDLAGMPPAERADWMRSVAVGEVWGVGRSIGAQLDRMAIRTVFDLADADPKVLRAQFGVVMERTAAELNGIACVDFLELEPTRKQIQATRSFGTMLTAFADLSAAVARHVESAAERLRAQRLLAGAILVFLRTNQFREADPQYDASTTVPLSDATADTPALIRAALHGLRKIHRTGYSYKKCGVMLLALQPAPVAQQALFDDARKRERMASLMRTVDAVNQHWGRGTVSTAAAGISRRGAMRSEHRTPRYTTRWDELPVAR
jgi:DNA polymerase V